MGSVNNCGGWFHSEYGDRGFHQKRRKALKYEIIIDAADFKEHICWDEQWLSWDSALAADEEWAPIDGSWEGTVKERRPDNPKRTQYEVLCDRLHKHVLDADTLHRPLQP